MDSNTGINGRVAGIFLTMADADGAYEALLNKGYTRENISVVMSEATHTGHSNSIKEESIETSHTLEDAGRGALLGGTAGAIVSAIAAIGSSLALPGFGLILVGPLLAGLTGAAAGSIAGGTIGAVMGAGHPAEHKEYYETSIQEGGVMISVSPKNALDKVEIIEAFEKNNGQRIFSGDHSAV
ncbi:hypothetical protein [Dyadobacter sp. CY356]|uniref:hypothetical protein n=1 Tax=Dyadobacter sp. CY356 TaxID=2906442 RepID=UPI001F1F6E77|nr:hypothetical protein [Dyadobacter sp. CY356]MCF0057065.1 hypothetical protein [Dyadobacter sp. CY356]